MNSQISPNDEMAELLARRERQELAKLVAKRERIRTVDSGAVDTGANSMITGMLPDSWGNLADNARVMWGAATDGGTFGAWDAVQARFGSMAGGESYDDIHDRQEKDRGALVKKNPGLYNATKLIAEMGGAGKLMNTGVTAQRLVKTLPETATFWPKVGEYVSKIIAGATDAAGISALMANNAEDRDVAESAELGAVWGAAFAALPTPVKLVANLLFSKKYGGKLYDANNNFLPPALGEDAGKLLKDFYRVVSNSIGGGRYRDQVARIDKMAKDKEQVIIKTNKESMLSYDISRKNQLHDEKVLRTAEKDASADILAKQSKDEVHALNKAITAETRASRDASRAEKKVQNNTSNQQIGGLTQALKEEGKQLQNTSNTATTQAEIDAAIAKRVAHNETLNAGSPVPITESGGAGITQAKEGFKLKYNEAWKPVDGLSKTNNTKLVAEIEKVKATLNNPADIAYFNNLVKTVKAIPTTAGRSNVRDLDKALRQDAFGAGSEAASKRDALLVVREKMTKLLPPEVVSKLNDLNKLYPMFKVNKIASHNSPKTDGVPNSDTHMSAVKQVSDNSGMDAPGHIASLNAHKVEQTLERTLENIKKTRLANTTAGKEATEAEIAAAKETRIQKNENITDAGRDDVADITARGTDARYALNANNKENMDKLTRTREAREADLLHEQGLETAKQKRLIDEVGNRNLVPAQEEIKRLNKLNMSDTLPQFPTAAATTGALGAVPAYLVDTLAGGGGGIIGFGGTSLAMGSTIANLASNPGFQKFLVGRTGFQDLSRRAADITGDALRKFDKFSIQKSFLPTSAGDIAINSSSTRREETDEEKRIRLNQ